MKWFIYVALLCKWFYGETQWFVVCTS